MPSRRKDTISPGAIAKRIKEGRGQGIGKNYKPWYYVNEVPSDGTASRVDGKSGRKHHLLSFGERKSFFCAIWPDHVVDTREQYPILPREDTVALAKLMGIRHPPGVLTVDLMHTVLSKRSDTYYVARDCKELKELSNRRTLEKLSLTLAATETRGIDYGLIITNFEFPDDCWRNVEWAFSMRNIEKLSPLTPAKIKQISEHLAKEIHTVNGPITLATVCSASDRALKVGRGDCLKVARFLIANKVLRVDMTHRIVPTRPTNVQVIDLEQFMNRICPSHHS